MATKKEKWRRAYDEEQVKSALHDVSTGVPLRVAANRHGVPRSSLKRYVGGSTVKLKRMGPSPTLSEEGESILLMWIEAIAEAGFQVNKDILIDSAQQVIRDLQMKTNFVNDRPGRNWFRRFLKRHPSVENKTVKRSPVTTCNLKTWFSIMYNYLKQNHFHSILREPNRVFNAAEAGFYLNPKGNKVLALKWDKNVCQQINSDEKEYLTVLMTANADGQLAPPMLIFKFENIPEELVNSIPSSWGFGSSKNGWMTGDLFYTFITNVFHPWLIKNNITLPVLLFVDGKKCHLTLQTSRFCNEHGIVPVSLLSNATHLIQPMEAAVFHYLKKNWKNKVYEWQLNNNADKLEKKDFVPLLKETLNENITPIIIKNGFSRCGLVPWNPSALPELKNTGEEDPETSFTILEECTEEYDQNVVVPDIDESHLILTNSFLEINYDEMNVQDEEKEFELDDEVQDEERGLESNEEKELESDEEKELESDEEKEDQTITILENPEQAVKKKRKAKQNSKPTKSRKTEEPFAKGDSWCIDAIRLNLEDENVMQLLETRIEVENEVLQNSF